MHRLFLCIALLLRYVLPVLSQGLQLSDKEIRSVVDLHNEARKAVKATAMKKVHWSNQLAAKAFEIAARCRLKHSVASIRDVQYEHVGENVFATSSGARPSMEQVVEAFIKEKQHYDANTGLCEPPSGNCGHYTQVVWANTEVIGCAMASCPDITGTSWSKYKKWIINSAGRSGGYLVTCLYGPGGNYVGQKPYVAADSPAVICTKCSQYATGGSSYECDTNGLCSKEM